MVDVATELRPADPSELILMIRGEQAANIADLVNSSSELFFQERHAALCAVGRVRRAMGLDADRPARHGVPLRGGVARSFKLDDRPQARRGRRRRSPVRRRQSRRSGEGRAPLRRDRRRAAAAASRLAARAARGRAGADADAAQAWSKAGRVILGHRSNGRDFDACPNPTFFSSPRNGRNGCRRAVADRRATSPTPTRRAIQATDLQPFSAVLDSTQVSMVYDQPGAHDAERGRSHRGAGGRDRRTGRRRCPAIRCDLENEMIKLGDVNRDYTMATNIKRAIHQMMMSALK